MPTFRITDVQVVVFVISDEVDVVAPIAQSCGFMVMDDLIDCKGGFRNGTCRNPTNANVYGSIGIANSTFQLPKKIIGYV